MCALPTHCPAYPISVPLVDLSRKYDLFGVVVAGALVVNLKVSKVKGNCQRVSFWMVFQVTIQVNLTMSLIQTIVDTNGFAFLAKAMCSCAGKLSWYQLISFEITCDIRIQ